MATGEAMIALQLCHDDGMQLLEYKFSAGQHAENGHTGLT
jgi:hypothetical protein